MERFDLSRNKKLINDESLFSFKHERENLELRVSSYKNGGFVEITSQVEMITNSLLACLQMSKSRPLRLISDVLTKPPLTYETFNDTQKETPRSNENMCVTHLLTQDNYYRKFEAWNAVISQNVLIDSNYKTCSSKDLPEILSQKTYKLIDQSDRISMVEIVQGEIQTLRSLAPSVSNTAANLSQWVSHYKDCTKCHEKISLLEILHRIQDLNLFIAKKRKKTSNQSTQIQQKELKSVDELKQETSNKSESFKQISKKESKKRRVGKSEVVDPATTAEGHPGVQIVLEADPEEKQFCHWIYNQVDDYSSAKSRSADFISPKLYSVAVFFASAFFDRSPDSVLVFNNPIEFCRTKKTTLEKTRRVSFTNRVYSCEKQSVLQKVNFCVVFFKKIGCLTVPDTLRPKSESLLSDESSSTLITTFIDEILGKMENKIVDTEVTSIKNLINEVQQSQIKLSKVLLNKGIFSQPLIKLTNPALLEEESKAMKKFSEIGNASVDISLDDLQDLMNNVKEKCTFKNRLIGTVIRGLQHNIPKEWWEEIVTCTFEGSNKLNEQEYEKVDGLLRQCSSYFKKHEKALEQQSPTERSEERREDELLSDEESNMKDNARVKIQDNSKTLSPYEDRVTNAQGSWTFPGAETYTSNQSTISQQSTSQPTPRENQARERWMKSLENQISILSVENTKLWEEIHALRDSVETTVKDVTNKKPISVSSHQSLQDTYTSPGKIINVTVQISSDRMGRRSKDYELLKLPRFNDTAEDGRSRTSKISLRQIPEYSRRPERRDSISSRRTTLSETKARLQIKSDRRRSQNDLNYLDDFSPSAPEQRQNREYKVINRETSPIVHQMSLRENPEVYNFLKESDGHESQKYQKPGPSFKSLEIDYLLQRPSLVKLGGSQTPALQATLSNERELQPIMENDHPDFASSYCTSNSLCQAVQHLRARVRSIQKEVTVLKSKNDRIDKLLDKLLDDAVDNNKSFEEIENNLKNFHRID